VNSQAAIYSIDVSVCVRRGLRFAMDKWLIRMAVAEDCEELMRLIKVMSRGSTVVMMLTVQIMIVLQKDTNKSDLC